MVKIKLTKSKNVFPLEIETAIVVPSTTATNRPVATSTMKKRVDEVRKKLSNMFGGYTSVRAVGGYTTKKGRLIKERVNVVQAYATRESYLKNKTKFVNYAKSLKKKWGQEAIGIIIENDLFFVS